MDYQRTIMPIVKERLTDKKIKAEIKKDTKTISDGSISGLALYKKKPEKLQEKPNFYSKKI